jgi:hypothetical protein
VLQLSVTNGLEGSKMVAQVLSIRKELDQLLKETAHAWLVSLPKTFSSKGNDGPTALKSKGTVLNNDVRVRSIHFFW